MICLSKEDMLVNCVYMYLGEMVDVSIVVNRVLMPIGPLQDPVTWYKIKYTGKQASCAVGLPKQRQMHCFGSPTVQLAYQYM